MGEIQIRFRHQLAIVQLSFSQLEDGIWRHVSDIGVNRARRPNGAHDVKADLGNGAAMLVFVVRMRELRTLLAVENGKVTRTHLSELENAAPHEILLRPAGTF